MMKRIIMLITISLLLCGASVTAKSDKEHHGFSLQKSRDIVSNYTFSDMMAGGEKSHYIYLNISEVSPTSSIERAGDIWPLPSASQTKYDQIANFKTNTTTGKSSLGEYIKQYPVDAVVVAHGGKIVYQAYPKMFDYQKHHMMSIAKSFISALIGILEAEGKIDVSKPISHYLTELAGSDWHEVSVIDVLDMSSGICDNPKDKSGSCINGFWKTFNTPSQDLLAHYTTMKAHRGAGEAFEYSNASSTLLSLLIERITGKKYADFLGEKIWRPMGAEGDLLIANGPDLKATAIGYKAATPRDIVRFGMLFTPSGKKAKGDIIPQAHIRDIQKGGRPSIYQNAQNMAGNLEIVDLDSTRNEVDGEVPLHNTYQWDVVFKDGDFFKGGFQGQGLYVSPSRDLVIVFFSHKQNEMGRISRQLAKSALFN